MVCLRRARRLSIAEKSCCEFENTCEAKGKIGKIPVPIRNRRNHDSLRSGGRRGICVMTRSHRRILDNDRNDRASNEGRVPKSHTGHKQQSQQGWSSNDESLQLCDADRHENRYQNRSRAIFRPDANYPQTLYLKRVQDAKSFWDQNFHLKTVRAKFSLPKMN